MTQPKLQHQAKRLLRSTPLWVGVLAIGCGGAGQQVGQPSGPTGSTNVGPAVVTYAGHPQPLVSASSGAVSTVGQAGAAFSTISVDPIPNLNSTMLAFTRQVGGVGTEFYTMPANGKTAPTQPIHTTQGGYPSFSSVGLIAFVTQNNGQYQIETMLYDGTQQHVVVANQAMVPTISPNGATIALLDALHGNIYTVPTSGGTLKEIYSGGDAGGSPIVWSPNGSQIAFSAKNSTTQYFNAFTMSATGGTPTNVVPSSYAGQGSAEVSAWSPDGNSLACTWVPRVGNNNGAFIISLNGGGYSYLTPNNYSDSIPCFSPDNNRIAFYRSNAGGATPGIYECDFAGTSPQLILADPAPNGATGAVVTMAWSPFPQNQKFVGSGGSLSTSNVAGFLLAQNGDQFGSMMTFAATTPSKATITPSTGNAPGAPIVYSLAADAITNISYANVFNGSRTTIALTSTPSAIVTVDGVTGIVDYVVPTTFKKPNLTPASASRSSLTYSGQFTAIYDASGKNLAPNGATAFEIDRITGKLVSFH